MKYRIQYSAAHNDTDANAVLNTMESVKDKVLAPTEYTEVEIERKSKKQEYVESFEVPTEYASIDFDATAASHSTTDGQAYYDVNIDISFDVQQDFIDCINYLETIKSLADNTKRRSCRHFECNHDEKPLVLDGAYTHMDFDASPVTYSI